MYMLIYIAAGGALGAILRYLVSSHVYRSFDGHLPWGTLAVNLLGCFVIGILWNVFEDQDLRVKAFFQVIIIFAGPRPT